MEQILGLVTNGQFERLDSPGSTARLTTIQPQEAIPPDAREIALGEHEGLAIAVEGQDQGGWIYSARITDKAGAILTEVVKRMYRDKAK